MPVVYGLHHRRVSVTATCIGRSCIVLSHQYLTRVVKDLSDVVHFLECTHIFQFWPATCRYCASHLEKLDYKSHELFEVIE